MSRVCLTVLALLLLAGSPGAFRAQEAKLGYDDTPLLPGGKWRVHDGKRPQPKVVESGGYGAGEVAAKPPADAIVLFDGKSLAHWKSGKGDAQWKVQDGYCEVNRTGNITTRESFGDCQLHLEWATPAKVESKGQGRGNSGVFLMGRYELQILDSYQNQTYPDGQAAALYGQYPPLVNACRAPGVWQTYDIVFRAPRFEENKLVSPASITVLHNGVLVHDRREFLGATAHRRVAKYSPHAATGPISLQDHGNPIRFRNIWLRKL